MFIYILNEYIYCCKNQFKQDFTNNEKHKMMFTDLDGLSDFGNSDVEVYFCLYLRIFLFLTLKKLIYCRNLM